MRILGASYGNPHSTSTYSGVPFALFNELETQGKLVDRININMPCVSDVFRNYIDINRSLISRRPKRNKYWRYLPKVIDTLSNRYELAATKKFPHDTVIQIGVGGLPHPSKFLFAHVEFSILTASNLRGFSKTYGFSQSKDLYLQRAIEGERRFMEQCDVIWTNSDWTHETFAHHQIPKEKFFIHPPVANISDPGELERDWSKPNVLFIGKDWNRKGGPQLLEAFINLKRKINNLSLTIIGCEPKVPQEKDIKVCGYLDKNNKDDAQIIKSELKKATLFCMPSEWESTGIVYMEAALFGLPSIMSLGQGREKIFPPNFTFFLKDRSISELSFLLEALLQQKNTLRDAGRKAREYAVNNYTWKTLTEKISDRIKTAKVISKTV